jgi:predicted ribosome quality control (RQC) complex YloA/Tae2 family protein
MIESQDLRAQIAELYDRELKEYDETIRNLTRAIAKKLDEELMRQVESSFAPDQSLEARDEMLRDCYSKVDTIARGIAGMVLRSELRDTEGMERVRSSYEQLHKRVPALASSLQDYWPRATKICQDERAKAEEVRKKLQDRIEKVQQELQRLLKPDS